MDCSEHGGDAICIRPADHTAGGKTFGDDAPANIPDTLFDKESLFLVYE